MIYGASKRVNFYQLSAKMERRQYLRVSCTDILAEVQSNLTADITIKTTNIPGLAHSGLLLSYDFSRRRNSAFAYGYNAVPRTGSSEKDITLSQRYQSGLEKKEPLWQHPLILPVILLKHELAMIRKIFRVQLQADRTDV